MELLKNSKFTKELLNATLIMANKILGNEDLTKFYEEAKHMLDILKIAQEDGIGIGRRDGIGIGRKDGIEIGMQKGRQEGAKNKAFEMAKILKQNGVAPGMISRASGISLQRVREL